MATPRSGIPWFDMEEVPYRASRLFRALSNPKAYALCRLLEEGKEREVGELVETLGRHQATVSKILRTLRDLNIVRYQKVGKSTFYTLKHGPTLKKLLRCAEEYIRIADPDFQQGSAHG